MPVDLDRPTEETKRLQGCINDLAALHGLPASWTGGSPSFIGQTLLDALGGMLGLDLAFIRLRDPAQGPPIEMARASPEWPLPARDEAVGQMLDRWLGKDPHEWVRPVRQPTEAGEWSIVPLRLGLEGELGVLVACSSRVDFPRGTERLLLTVAANLGSMGLQQARVLDEQKRLAEALGEAERESRMIVDNIPGLVALLSPSGYVEVANRQLLEYFGQTLGELRQWGTNNTTHPEDAPRLVEAFTRAIATGEPFELESRARRHDGVYRWLQSRHFPLRDSEGRIVRWCNLLIDIDERKRAEEALAASEHNLKLTIDTVPAMAWSARPDGSAEFFNQHFLDFVGLSEEQARDWGWTFAAHPDDLNGLAATWQRIIASEAPGEAEARLRRHDGVYRWFLFRAHPLRDDTGRILKWYGVNTDIEDRKRVEEELRSSELSLRQMTETIPEMLWSATPEGAIDYCNARFLNYTGLSAEELMGDGWQKSIDPDDAARVAPVWMTSIATGAPYRVEVRTFHCADRTYRWCAVSALPLLDPAGRILKWHGTIVDIHDWKQAQEELRRSEAFLAEAQRLSLTGSFSWRVATDEITWSDQVYRIFGLDPAVPLTFERIGLHVHPDDRAPFSALVERARAEGVDFEEELRLLLPDGSVRYLHVVAHAIRNPVSSLEYMGAVQDVTERRRAQEELDRARSELTRVARITSLGTLAASIAHEVNQPLSGIVTNASTCLRMLAAEPPNLDGARETARRTIRDGHRASEVVNRLRGLFTRKEMVAESVDLNAATREVIALTASDFRRGSVVVREELADDLPTVTGDRVQLQQVILNLLLNAADAMNGVDDRPRELVVRSGLDEGGVCVSVQDSGVGFAPEDRDRLFEAFYTTKAQGMGIGLSVSRSVIERHHGRLWATSNDGPGATFTFSVPVSPDTKVL
jgi:PAS domain S-box-containing protein